jgi:hypothetical protein
LGFLETWFALWKIWPYHWIEHVELYLELALKVRNNVRTRIWGGFTEIFIVKYQYFGIFGDMVGAVKNLTIPVDRARRVVLETSMESLEQCS